MDSLVDPSGDFLFDSVATIVTARGTEERAPRTDEEWTSVRRAAIRIMEATNLLLMPGRHVAKPGEKSDNPEVESGPEAIEALINKDRTAWTNLAHGLNDAAMLALQAELERFEWLALLPHDYLHVSLNAPVGPAKLTYARMNCFHCAVVVEVASCELHEYDPRPTFLPHLTLAITKRPAPPGELRAVLEPLRETFLGRQHVEESIRVSFPFSRERLFEPWTVHERVPVGR